MLSWGWDLGDNQSPRSQRTPLPAHGNDPKGAVGWGLTWMPRGGNPLGVDGPGAPEDPSSRDGKGEPLLEPRGG